MEDDFEAGNGWIKKGVLRRDPPKYTRHAGANSTEPDPRLEV